MKRPFGSLIMTRVNFEVKRAFYSEIGGVCVDTKFWHVTRKSVVKKKRFLLRGGFGEVVACQGWKSCWLRKGRLTRYFGFGLVGVILFFRVVLFLKIESCFAVIGYDCVSVGYKYEPPGYCKDWYTSNKHKFTLLAIYFSVGGFAIFLFFTSSFELIKDASYSSDLVCW